MNPNLERFLICLPVSILACVIAKVVFILGCNIVKLCCAGIFAGGVVLFILPFYWFVSER